MTKKFIRSGQKSCGGLRTEGKTKQYSLNEPVVTVITVVFNGAKTIENTIQSVIGQNYHNVEYIIVDGGSADGTLDILDKYSGNIDCWVSEKDAGIYDAMNKGIALAGGDIVGFLNADDFFADLSVLEQVAGAFRDASTEACYADLVYVDAHTLKPVRYWRSRPFLHGMFALGWCPPHPTFYVRKSVVDHHGGFDLSFRLAADAELMIRYLEEGKIIARYVPGIWVKMRLGGQTNQSWRNIIRQNREILRALNLNGIRVSKVRFIASKLFDRIGQFVMARGGA